VFKPFQLFSSQSFRAKIQRSVHRSNRSVQTIQRSVHHSNLTIQTVQRSSGVVVRFRVCIVLVLYYSCGVDIT
jgi:hypothetical protein